MDNPSGTGFWSALMDVGDRLAVVLPGVVAMVLLVVVGRVGA